VSVSLLLIQELELIDGKKSLLKDRGGVEVVKGGCEMNQGLFSASVN
jgi:hypothetical protein